LIGDYEGDRIKEEDFLGKERGCEGIMGRFGIQRELLT
jgi:hypothetical protein